MLTKKWTSGPTIGVDQKVDRTVDRIVDQIVEQQMYRQMDRNIVQFKTILNISVHPFRSTFRSTIWSTPMVHSNCWSTPSLFGPLQLVVHSFTVWSAPIGGPLLHCLVRSNWWSTVSGRLALTKTLFLDFDFLVQGLFGVKGLALMTFGARDENSPNRIHKWP